MSKPTMTKLIAGVTALLTLFSTAFADEAAEQYIQAVLDEAEPYLTAEDQTVQLEGIEQLVDQHVDMRRVALFALGQYARRISDEQKAVYLPLFKEYATAVYQNALSNYAGEKLQVTGSVDRSERDIIVNSKVIDAAPSSSLNNLKVHWRVYRNRDGVMSVVDAGADNVWLAIEQRSQFTSIIANNGGPPAGFDALNVELQDQLGR